MSNKADVFSKTAKIAKGILIMLLVVLSYYAVQYIVSFVIDVAGISMSNAVMRIIYTAVWIACAAAVSLCFKKNFFEDYRVVIKRNRTQLAVIPVCALLAFVLGAALNNIIGYLIDVLPVPEAWIKANNESVSSAGSGGMAAVLIALYVAAPLSEELVFRGKGYRHVEESCGRIAAAVISSLLFAFAHGNMLQGIYAFAAGMLFSIIISRSGSLITGVFAHMGFNISNALTFALFRGIDGNILIIGTSAVFVLAFTGIFAAGSLSDVESADENKTSQDKSAGEGTL